MRLSAYGPAGRRNWSQSCDNHLLVLAGLVSDWSRVCFLCAVNRLVAEWTADRELTWIKMASFIFTDLDLNHLSRVSCFLKFLFFFSFLQEFVSEWWVFLSEPGSVIRSCETRFDSDPPPPIPEQYTEREGLRLGLVGWVKNTFSGTVVGQVQGPADLVEEMWVWDDAAAHQDRAQSRTDQNQPAAGFFDTSRKQSSLKWCPSATRWRSSPSVPPRQFEGVQSLLSFRPKSLRNKSQFVFRCTCSESSSRTHHCSVLRLMTPLMSSHWDETNNQSLNWSSVCFDDLWCHQGVDVSWRWHHSL